MSDYLEKNLLPLILSITPSTKKSYIIECLGGDSEIVSEQSCVIKFGIQMENFFNKVISDVTENLVYDNPVVQISGINHQVDHVFKTKDNSICYLECKCNLNLDSEKIRGCNEKVKALAEYFGNVTPTYFIPVCRQPYQEDVDKYMKKGITVVGVEWLQSQINLPFSMDEYFQFLNDVVGPIMEEKGVKLHN